MSDSSDKSKPENKLSLDLSSLQDLNFGPDWSDSARAAESRGKNTSDKGGGERRPPRDRRPERPQRRSDYSSDTGGPRPERQGGGDRPPRDDRRGAGARPPRDDRRGTGPRRDRENVVPFKPVVDVAFYPEDTPFKALCHAMRGNCRTYELFEIARLILDKPERFVVVLHPKKNEGPQEFFISVPDGLPFTTEEQAIAHVLKHHLDKFAQTEEVYVDPPKGNFPAINKCGVTGELLGPPNYHRYQSLLHEHHALNLPNMPFEKFQSRIESVKDEEVVQQWIEKMRKTTRYVVKMSEDEAQAFDNLESLKFYLTNQRKNELVRTTNQTRFSGTQAEQLPRGPLRDSVFGWREQQQRFPLETANNLRGRLRRMHFTIYKRGSKGASFVCAVKRKFRLPQTRLAESLQELIDFIEKHPNINVSDLPEQFLGIDIKKAKATSQPTEKAPDIEAVPEEVAQRIVEKHEQKRAAKQAAEGIQDSSPSPKPEAVDAVDGAVETNESEPSVEPTAEASNETLAEGSATQTVEAVEDPLNEEPEPAKTEPAKPSTAPQESSEEFSLRQLMFELRWLITEGYVTEYGDGRLFAPPPMDETPRDDEAKSTSTKPAGKAPKKSKEPTTATTETTDTTDSSIDQETVESKEPPASVDESPEDGSTTAAEEPLAPASSTQESTTPAQHEAAVESDETIREEAGQNSTT